MKNIFKKASELGKAIGDSVGDVVDDIKEAADDKFSSETGFLVETFDSPLTLSTRLNELQDSMKEVDMQGMFYDHHASLIVATFKITD